MDFDVAWERALYRLEVRGADSSTWRAAMTETKDEWKRAYYDEPRALAALAGLSIDELLAAARFGVDELELAA
jgi:hypothetical protein